MRNIKMQNIRAVVQLNVIVYMYIIIFDCNLINVMWVYFNLILFYTFTLSDLSMMREVNLLNRGNLFVPKSEMLIKEKVESKEIKLLKVASADNTLDLGTKRLALPLFNKLTSRIIDKSLRVNL